MEFESIENNQDIEKSDNSLYNQIVEKAKLAQQSPAEYIFEKTIDVLLEDGGFEPSKIVQAFADQASQKFNNSEATIHLQEAARELFEVERSAQSNF